MSNNKISKILVGVLLMATPMLALSTTQPYVKLPDYVAALPEAEPKEFYLEYAKGFELVLKPYLCINEPGWWYAEVRNSESGKYANGCWARKNIEGSTIIFTQISVGDNGKGWLDFQNNSNEFTPRY
jgi:hypothetical protein